jgi:Zn-dependent protease with chaperone function
LFAAGCLIRRSWGGFRAAAVVAAALPDGTVALLDHLITAIDDEQQIFAFLAHELGHVQGRHGLKLLLRRFAVGALATL